MRPMGKKSRADELDLNIRKYKKQLERLADKEGSEKTIRDIKSRLALDEKRLKELTVQKDKTTEPADSTLTVYSDQPPAKSITGLSDDDAKKIVDEVYLRTLSRTPSSIEFEKSRNAIAIAENPYNGISDVLWALINSKEFILNH